MFQWAHTVGDSLEFVGSHLTSPNHRLFIGYLFTSVMLAGWVFLRRPKKGSFIAYLFPKETWLGASSRLDFQLILVNGFIKVAFLSQFIVVSLALAEGTHSLLTAAFGAPRHFLSPTYTLVGYTLTLLLLNDFVSYWVHRAMHEVHILWRFHQVHHSASTLTPFTLLRLHPVEILIHHGRHILVAGFVAGAFDFATPHPLSVFTFLGVHGGTFLFFTWGANLRHSHVELSYWEPLERLFISPHQHQIHHSVDPLHHHKNYGAKFAFWDWAMGTLALSSGGRELAFGLPDGRAGNQTLYQALLGPFYPCLARVRGRVEKRERPALLKPLTTPEFPTNNLPPGS